MALEMWNGSVCVTMHGRDQPDVAGQRGHPGGDQHRVQAPAHLVGAPVRRAVRAGLEAEAVLDGDEVEQASFGFGDAIDPVARR